MTPVQYTIGAGFLLLLALLGFKEYEYLDLKAKFADYRASVETAAAKSNAAALDQVSGQALKNQSITEKKLIDDKNDALKQQEDIHAIQTSPKTDDGPVAPVLRHTIDSLR